MLYFKLKSLIYITIYNFKSFIGLINYYLVSDWIFSFSACYTNSISVHFLILILTYLHEAEHHQ